MNIHVALAGGAGPTLLALNDHTVQGKAINIAVVLGVIFTLASLLLRTPLGGAYVTAPLTMALVFNLGLFAWLGVAFDLVAIDTSGRAVLFVALAISADFAVFAVSDFYSFRILGIFLPLTMLVSCLTALTLLPALVLIFRLRFILAPGGKAGIERKKTEYSPDPLVP